MYKGVRVSTLLIFVGDVIPSQERKQKRREGRNWWCVCEAIGVGNHQEFKCGSIIVRKV